MPWVLERRTDKAPLTTNGYMSDPRGQRLLQRKKARDYAITKEWREWAAKQYAELLWEPVGGPVEISVHALRKARSRIDVEAMLILAKAMKDGLTDAGMWTDDHDGIVREMRLRPHIVTGYYGVRLVIRELAVHTGPTINVMTPASGITLTGSPMVEVQGRATADEVLPRV